MCECMSVFVVRFYLLLLNVFDLHCWIYVVTWTLRMWHKPKQEGHRFFAFPSDSIFAQFFWDGNLLHSWVLTILLLCRKKTLSLKLIKLVRKSGTRWLCNFSEFELVQNVFFFFFQYFMTRRLCMYKSMNETFI